MANPTLSAATAGSFTIGGDMRVNRLGFGAMRITGKGIWGPPPDKASALAILRRAVELDVNLIDTADSYGPDVSEELIAEALTPYRAGIIIATKGGNERTGPDVWVPNGRPDHLRTALEGSLRKLGVEHIDLYQLHRVDPKVPFEESVGALADLQREGKIRHVGLSNFNVPNIERARKIVPVVSVQNRFNNATGGEHEYNGVKDRETLEVVDYCTREGLAFFPWGPLAAGKLSSEKIDRLAKTKGAQMNQIALAWLLHRSPAIVPIPGTSSIAHLEENVAAGAIELTEDEFESLAVAS